MSQAEELLNSLPESETTARTVDPSTEPHIVVNADRTITIPDELKHIAVQFDHNIETVTFDCPRFWDEHDFSTMKVYIVYRRPDGYKDRYQVKNLCVDSADTKMIHFDWTISKNVTPIKGNISFIVCINKVDDEAIETNHWNSRLNQDLVVDEGLECSTDEIVEQNPDVLEDILIRLNNIEQGAIPQEQIAEAVEAYMREHPVSGGVDFETDDTLKLENGVLSVNTTDVMEQDNTRPITSAGVYATVGNIEALLKTI